jgi:hypothetical protein
MVETSGLGPPPEGDGNNYATFSFSKRAHRGMRELRINYHGIKFHGCWPDTAEGVKDLVNFSKSFDSLIEVVLKEVAFHNETSGLDDAIERMLGEGDQ